MKKWLIRRFKLKTKYKIGLEYIGFERPRYYLKFKPPLNLRWYYLDAKSFDNYTVATMTLDYIKGNAQNCFLYKDEDY